jgi:UDPglucose 6-dehydrogenase
LGKALDVFLNPDRVVVGVRNGATQQILEILFKPITEKIEWMSVESAEMTKHAINAFLASSVAFANEIAAICELVGADAKEVERGLKTETRIGAKAYLSPGGPFAGGTLARDVAYLCTESQLRDLTTPLLSSVRISNDEHKNWVRRKLLQQFSDLAGVAVAVWGLTYKPGTDTLRRSLAVELCDWLLVQGATVYVFDPAVKSLPERWRAKVSRCSNALDAVLNAKALVVCTEWPEFKQAANELTLVAHPSLVVVDANRHLQVQLIKSGIQYVAVGSPMGSGGDQ